MPRVHATPRPAFSTAADDEPSPPGDPLTFAAQLLDVAPPPEIPSPKPRVDVTAGAELLAGMPARAETPSSSASLVLLCAIRRIGRG